MTALSAVFMVPAAAASEGGGGGDGGHFSWFNLIPGLDSLGFLSEAGRHSAHIIPTAWLVLALLVGLALAARKGLMAARARGGVEQFVPSAGFEPRNLFEMGIEGMLSLFTSTLGSREQAIAYFPLFATLFIYILASNLIGLVPGFLPPSADMSNNLAMALVVFVVFNVAGFRKHGLGYLKHMLGPLLPLAPLIFVLEVLDILVRPLSLSLRLLGNMTGDHLVFGIFSQLVPVGVPALFLGVGMFVSFIQAFVFTLLSVVYVALATQPHEEHH